MKKNPNNRVESNTVAFGKRWLALPILVASLTIGACNGEVGGKVTRNPDGTVSGEIWGKVTFLVPFEGTDHIGQLVAHLPENITMGTPTITHFSAYVPLRVDRATMDAVESLLSNMNTHGFDTNVTMNNVLQNNVLQ